MYSLSQLQKQQVGLRLPKYLIQEIDEISNEYSLSRTEIITESIKNYLKAQKTKEFYDSFDRSSKELKKVIGNPEKSLELQTLDELLDEL